jgi:hypothetical protein
MVSPVPVKHAGVFIAGSLHHLFSIALYKLETSKDNGLIVNGKDLV